MSYPRKLSLNPDKKLRAYIIGVALGDGNLSNPNGRAPRLRISCDKKYPELVNHISHSLQLLFPENKVGLINRKSNCVDISIYSNHLPTMLNWNSYDGPKDKQNVSVPLWIKKDRNLIRGCLRGLFQTDGSIYMDRKYLMVNFVNTAPKLSSDVFMMIKKIGYQPNLQKLKQKNGKTKHTIRISRDSQKFIEDIDYWKK